VHMDISVFFIFRILKILKSYIFISPKIIMLKYIGRYLQEEHAQKSSVKKYVVFWKL
jgi:hypothetical protein